MGNEISLIDCISQETGKHIVMSGSDFVYFDTKQKVESAIVQSVTLARDSKNIKIAKENKTLSISNDCANEIISGFSSDALGTTHIYQSEQIDQLNLIGAVAGGTDDYFKAGTKDADDVITYEYKMHTAVQLLQVLNDGKAYKQTLLQKANGLKVQVAEATTVEEIEATVW